MLLLSFCEPSLLNVEIKQFMIEYASKKIFINSVNTTWHLCTFRYEPLSNILISYIYGKVVVVTVFTVPI